MRHLIMLAVSLATLTGFALPASAQTTTTPASPCAQWITSVPTTITAPGYYCLKQNISTNLTGGAIGIESSDVTLDCRGRSITHIDPANDASAITGGGFGPVHDVTVRSCKVVDFGTGINFGLGSDRIEFLNNDILQPKIDGIVLWGSHSRIVGNSVINAHNTFMDYVRNITIAPSEPGVRSTGNVVMNNVVTGSYGNSMIFGIRIDMSDDVLISNNQVIDLKPSEGGYASAIQSDGGANVRLISNVMMSRTGNNYGNLGSPTLCTRNIAIGLTTPGFEWCTQSTNNTVQP